MKYAKSLVLIMICLIAIGCDKFDDGSYVEPITIYEKIGGEWNLTSLKMVDEFAKSHNMQPTEQDLSALFNYGTFQIAFNVDAKNQPTTYKVSGDVPPLFEPSGYWKLDNAFQQTDGGAALIQLYSDATKTQKTDDLRLISVPGNTPDMQFQLVRSSEGNAFVSYIFSVTANN